MVLAQGVEHGGRDSQHQRVLDRGEVVGRGGALEQRGHRERGAALGALDEVAVAVADVDRARAQDVHDVGVLADLQDHRPAAEVAHLELCRQSVQQGSGQRVERRVLRQEVPDLDELGVHDPRIMARPGRGAGADSAKPRPRGG
jgi:hypothetical protein